MTAARVQRVGLIAGPLAALVCYALLPLRYSTGPGEWVDFTQAGRATIERFTDRGCVVVIVIGRNGARDWMS